MDSPRPLSGNILITGGSGFLGRAILRRAALEHWDASFTVYSRDEAKQWELRRRFPGVRCILGDVARDMDRLRAAMAGHDTVIHAAAVKYIPEAEWNVSETIDVNVVGSRNVAYAAIVAGVQQVIGISTDKACQPANTYGATKLLMERMFGEAGRMSATRFATVRYGNVVGSTGSVIPVFRQQLELSGSIKLTAPGMTRFWLGADQAIDLILWAAEGRTGFESRGATFIAGCPAMAIIDLAQAVWLESGRDGPVELELVGIRPGEKMHEELYSPQEAVRIYQHERGFVLLPATSPPALHDPPPAQSYSSEAPTRWLGIGEMQVLMGLASRI